MKWKSRGVFLQESTLRGRLKSGWKDWFNGGWRDPFEMVEVELL